MRGSPAAFPAILILIAALLLPASPRADEVPYVTTPDPVVEAMLSIADVGPGDILYDLGSGDGRIVIAAAKRHVARATGIEYDKKLVAESREIAAREGVSDRARFLEQDIFLTDFRDATVVTMYLLPEVNLQLRPRILDELSPGTRVVSHDWDMGDWKPDDLRTIPMPEKEVFPAGESTVFLWIVPARIAGNWRGTLSGPDGAETVEIGIDQRYQRIEAKARLNGKTLAGGGRIRGKDVSLELDRPAGKPGAPPLRFSLRTDGNSIEGDAVSGKERFSLKANRAP
ncbi:MAG: class I SAM-dependent methyltransferase [Thermodesulfobacteriota bacterium]